MKGVEVVEEEEEEKEEEAACGLRKLRIIGRTKGQQVAVLSSENTR